MPEVLAYEPPERTRGSRALIVLAGLAVAGLAISRLVAADEPVATPPVPPSTEEPAPAPLGQVLSGHAHPIADAPIVIRLIELVSASRLAVFHGQLDGETGRTTLPVAAPFATDDVRVLSYGAGVVVGPSPGAAAPATVRVLGVDVVQPSEPVAGILPAIGGGYWSMDTAVDADGSCQMHLVMLTGQVSDVVVKHPCTFVPEAEIVTGFVGRVGPRVAFSSGTLLDRETGALTPIGGALLAARDRFTVSWTRDIADPLVVEDVVSAETFDVVLPPGRVARQVALSVGGRYLAVMLVEQLIGVRTYEVWVHDLVGGTAQMATLTTLDDRALELAWRGDVLVVVGNDVEAFDASTGQLYQSELEPLPSRLDSIAMPFALG